MTSPLLPTVSLHVYGTNVAPFFFESEVITLNMGRAVSLAAQKQTCSASHGRGHTEHCFCDTFIITGDSVSSTSSPLNAAETTNLVPLERGTFDLSNGSLEWRCALSIVHAAKRRLV
jgi:hypothetical protein